MTSIKVRAETRDRLKHYMSQLGASSAEEALARALFVAETVAALQAIDPGAIQDMHREAADLAEVERHANRLARSHGRCGGQSSAPPVAAIIRVDAH